MEEEQGPRVLRSRGPKVLWSQGPRYLKVTFKYELDSKECGDELIGNKVMAERSIQIFQDSNFEEYLKDEG